MSIRRFFRSRRVFPVLWAVRPDAGFPVVPVDGSGGGSSGDPDPAVAARIEARRAARAEQDKQQGGDPNELHNLVVDHGDAVYRLAKSIVRDSALAEDVAQDTMLKAWLALPNFRGDSSLRSWVMRIAHNTAISTLRARRASVTDPNDMPEETIKPHKSIERRVESESAMDDFVEALDLLDDLSRSIVVLREIEGMAYEEIADVLDVPLPTVKTRLLRARRRLSAALREWE